MYSYEDRIRAVRLYLELDRRLGVTLRTLGYPTKNALLAWVREYESRADLKPGYRREKRQYDESQKQIAVEHYLKHGHCLAYTVRALGYPSRETLRHWLDELRPDLRRLKSGMTPPREYAFIEKQHAVVALNTRAGAARELAQEVGVSRQTLYNWQSRLLGEKRPDDMSKNKNASSRSQRDTLCAELAVLEQRVQKLRLEHDILNKANELLKKDPGIDPRVLTNQEKTQLIDALRIRHPLKELLIELQLARSTYFYHRMRRALPDKYATVRHLIAEIFHDNYECYGYRRIDGMLRRDGVRISEKVVRRLMAEEGLVVPRIRRRRFSAYAGESCPAAQNMLNRNFQASAPNTKWLTDLSEIHIPAGKLYISPIIDCFDGLVVSWTIGTRPDAKLVNTMLENAIDTLRPDERPIIHTVRGAHYRWPQWLQRVHEARLTRSMSRKGCSPDNAACEGFFGRLKTELFHPRNWQQVSLDECMRQIDAYIRWYNEKRIKLSLGRRSPVEYRQAMGLMN